jgi:hypothetical protein
MKWIVMVACIALLQTAKAGEDDESGLVFEGAQLLIALNNEPIKLEVYDDVSDGCMPNPSAVEQAWEVELRRLGFEFTGDGLEQVFAPEISVEAFGFETSDWSCAVTVSTSFSQVLMSPVPYTSERIFIRHQWEVARHLLTGTKSDMNKRISDLAREHVNNFYLTKTRMMDRLESEYPKFLQEYRRGKASSGNESNR